MRRAIKALGLIRGRGLVLRAKRLEVGAFDLKEGAGKVAGKGPLEGDKAVPFAGVDGLAPRDRKHDR